MVKLTADLIAKQALGHNKRRADESVEHYLSRLTHLPFQNRGIDSIDPIPPCRQLTVIYLYDNTLSKLENFNFAENLTHLYLQNNRLQKLEHFDGCPKLQKLYLGGNQIQVIEGLDRCMNLKEIYIENQRLPEGEKLVFDPRTLQCLARVLENINVSGNNLDSLVELSCLEKLEELTASNNNLENLRELIQLLSVWPRLKRLDTSRNPMCTKARYRERLIVVSTALEMLDGKQITDNSRQFLMSWKASREAQQIREKSKADLYEGSGDYTNNGNYRRSIVKADLGLVKKGQFPMALVENAHRKMTPRTNKFSGFFASNSFHNPEPNTSHPNPIITFQDPSTQTFFK
ncbi:unnamed protein product [Rotaria socialis]|uniref:Protein phosphatase 1 regulatory subunit 42 n=1 Tax=Rotaria socialis TaxID=392032 RepID=A0A818HED8_9BILA|nr:unnamed protein product [Rotaria socialis]CAF4884538.1 unnamed protein product [Rotaria socialis]